MQVMIRGNPAKCDEYKIFQQVTRIDKNAWADRGHKSVIDAIDFFWIGIGACQWSVENAHNEKNIRVLEPFYIISNRLFRHVVPQWFQVASKIVDGIQGGGVVHQPVGKILYKRSSKKFR